MRLAELQRAVQEHLLAGGDPPATLVAGVRPPAVERWRVYSDAYRIRLVAALAKGYPAIARRLGERTFGALMLDFVAAQPSVHRSVRDYGAELAAWLRAEAADAEGAELAMLADLAAFEWALAAAYDAADASPVTHAELARVPPDEWATLRFGPAPDVRRVATTTNALDVRHDALERADSTDDTATALPAAHTPARTWLVWRAGLDPRFRALDDAEAAAFDQCAGGASFGEFCEALQHAHGDAALLQAVTWLKAWTADGLLVRA